ncbi:EexN family lipoprotein [Paracraurococcus lichenis]|uniref:EexN family lipoprotein n=1 Tax=Paracraurococcus lichenis TaxID=3064888 RepID=A0ABT9EAK0_9PROT|nr:EexN family lipoprotein [Paracraurococcus sp. LOR1-02]MDO9713193.1 EexN family lipoprotein [Paracraurococcus sp. LOR1-02]
MVNRHMRTATAVVLALTACCASAEAQSRRTVSYFLANPAERDTVLRECRNDERAARMPECANAQRAADQAARDAYLREQRQQHTPTPNELLTSRQYYVDNPIARAVVLEQCSRGAARLSDCEAARAAGR